MEKIKNMKKYIVLILFVWISFTNGDAKPQYTREDSLKVMRLLAKGRLQKKGTNMMIYFARQIKCTPYVAKTLEKNETERLVINLRQLDCTTYVESVLALTECIKHNKTRFSDYCYYLQQIRYKNGTVYYPARQHYFSVWITENTKKGFVTEIQGPTPPFTAIHHI